MVWLAPWGEVANAHPWRNIIVHQTEGPAGSAHGGALEQAKNPARRGVMVWVDTDGTVYWAVAETRVTLHGDGANRNDNKYIDNSQTYHQVVRDNSIGVEFAGNYPDVTRPATEAQVAAWRILVRVLRARYGIRPIASMRIIGSTSRMLAIARAARSRPWRGSGRNKSRPLCRRLTPFNEKSRRCRRLFRLVSIRHP
jgi:N-acetylmuramoyl-L-alanine amidase